MTLSLKPFRRAAVPLLAVQTADPAGVVRLARSECVNGATSALLIWNCIHGIVPGNDAAQELAANLNGNQPAAIATGNPIEALRALETLGTLPASADGKPAKPVAVLLGLADVLLDPQAGTPARQALWNLRDALPPSAALVVMCVPMGWRNPFPNDIAVAEDPLPDRPWLSTMVTRYCEQSKAATPTADTQAKAADALVGLSGFAAEQATALSLSKAGVDLAGLWERKRQQISETPGLSVYSGGERFSDLGGMSQAKEYFSLLLNGERPAGAEVWVDEIDKAVSGTAGDSSGVSQNIMGYLLTYMQETRATGSIFIGPGGSGKSAFAKALGNEAGIPTIQLDLGGLKGSLVGESEGRMRAALAVITAVSAGRPMFCATCNSIATLPPELRRRFTLGTMFFDLPSDEERRLIWPIHIKKLGLDPTQELPKSDGWTGSDIATCCDLSSRMRKPLLYVSKFVTPISVSASEQIDRLRTESSGRYLNAGAPGMYQKPSRIPGSRSI